MIVDYHMHLRDERGEIAHTAAAVEPFVATAWRRGVDEIGFTEHVYYFEQTREIWDLPYQTERCVYDIEKYVLVNQPSPYVSTTYDHDLYKTWYKSGYNYYIDAPGGVDVNKTIGDTHKWADQVEVAFPGGIARQYIIGVCPVAEMLPAETAWVRSVAEALRPYASGDGSYVNGSADFDDADPVAAAYGATKFARLVELKAKYDPSDLLHGNARVSPVG